MRINRDDVTRFLEHDLDVTSRTIYMAGEVDDAMAHRVLKSLHVLSLSRKEEKINIILNSDGGDVTQGLAIFDAIRQCESQVHIRVLGHAESMAAIILQAADHRQITENSILMIHDGTVNFGEGHPKNVKAAMKLSDRDDELCRKILLDRIQKKDPAFSWAKFRRIVEFDTYFTADQAFKYGLVDEVLYGIQE